MTPITLDTEVYLDYFLCMFKKVGGTVIYFEMYEGHPLDITAIRYILDHYEIVTFNGNGYDLPIVELALSGASCETLKRASDKIIKDQVKSWELERIFNIKIKPIQHIDLIEIPRATGSLKIFGGRVHTKKMQDLPIPEDASISPKDRRDLIEYCENDNDITADLFRILKPEIDLRRGMSKEYGIDLLSKSDAQIAEAVIKAEVHKLSGVKVKKSHGQSNRYFNYEIPDYIKFKSEDLNEVINILSTKQFFVDKIGKIVAPEGIEKRLITIGNSAYTLGIGGLHSTEDSVAVVTDGTFRLFDSDVISYYPIGISNSGKAPENMGHWFIQIYREFIAKRIEAKKNKNKIVAEVLKIFLNGSYGKFGSMYSYLYAPHLLIQTTMTGQLSLLMLIEKLEEFDIPVISANTDGIVIKCPTGKNELMSKIISFWEKRTNFEMEQTEYTALYSRDVNNYIALKPNGDVKAKGAYGDSKLEKNPQNEVCIKAVVDYLKSGVLIEDSIMQCDDPRMFVSVRNVTGGAIEGGTLIQEEGKSVGVAGGKYVGKAIRWYMAKNHKDCLRRKATGGMVPKTYGAKPLMELSESLPEDINYDWYIKEATGMLMDLGAIERPPEVKLPRKNTKEWKKLLADGLIELDPEDPKENKYRYVR